MGAGPTKIDYKERDFTKQPLEKEEIDVLLQALPEENVIDSIESEGKEKILRSMSDQKVFNLKGDNIFDYYFTNNKEAIKGCMTSQFTRDGTPCPDEKFNRMITKIPDLVQGPLREKETEWDTERTELQSQYDDDYKKSLKELVERTSGPPHKNISKKECYDWAEMKGLENSGDYSHQEEPPGCFLYTNNKVYYNKTGDTNRDCDPSFKCIQKEDYKPLFNSFRKNALEDVEEVTTGKPLKNLTKRECYQWADMKGLDNRGKYNHSDEVPGCFLYTNNDVYYNETGNKDKECSTSFKCIQKPKKYSEKEFNQLCKPLTKEDFKIVDSGEPSSKYKDVSSGTPSKNMTEDECKAFGKTMKGRVWTSTGSWANDPTGCITDGKKTWFNKDENSHDCGYRGYDCVEKNTKNVSEQQCKAYAKLNGYNYSLDNIKNNNNDCQAWANGVECTKNPSYMWGNCKKACYEKFNPKGCVIRNNDVWFNKKESDRKCGEQSINCIQKT